MKIVGRHRLLAGLVEQTEEACEPIEDGHADVGPAGHAEHAALAFAVLGHEAHAGGERGAHRAEGQRAAVEFDRARGARIEAEDCLRDLAAAGTDESGEADDLAGADFKIDVGKFPRRGEVAHAQHGVAGLGLKVARPVLGHAAPDHEPHDGVVVHVRAIEGADVAAVAQHADAVAQAEKLRHAVRHVDDGEAARLQPLDEFKEMLGVGRGERAGGLVEDDDARVGADRGGDLHELLLRGGEGAHGEVDVERDLDRAEQFGGAAAHGLAVQQQAAGAARVAAEAEIFRDAEVWAKGEFLVDHSHARIESLARGTEDVGDAVDDDVPGVGPVDAGEDLAERGLAGAVFAHEAVALAAAEAEGDVGQRGDAAEGLGDGAETDEIGGGFAHGRGKVG